MPLASIFKKIIDWKHWPLTLFYLPLYPWWLYYCLKSGSFWFFSNTNPGLSFSGFEGELKSEMYALLPTATYPETIVIKGNDTEQELLQLLDEAQLQFPIAVKPDAGKGGILFRKLGSIDQLTAYHRLVKADFIAQDFVHLPCECSVFYYRFPESERGNLSGFIKKDLAKVTGDGSSTLEELAKAAHLKVRWNGLQKEYRPSSGETVYVSHIGNLNNGSEFSDQQHLINPTMVKRFDGICRKAGFLYGRFDLKCISPEDLAAGGEMKILEFNGAGSIPNHIFTGSYSLFSAWGEVIKHWKLLHVISMQQAAKGVKPWLFLKGWRFIRRCQRMTNDLKKKDQLLHLPGDLPAPKQINEMAKPGQGP